MYDSKYKRCRNEILRLLNLKLWRCLFVYALVGFKFALNTLKLGKHRYAKIRVIYGRDCPWSAVEIYLASKTRGQLDLK